MTSVYLEIGPKKVFACALDWPGWARSGRGEEAALEALAGYVSRYAEVCAAAGLAVPGVTFSVVERVKGNATTEFGAPDISPEADAAPLDAAGAAREAALVRAAWDVFDRITAVTPEQLRKGPRGGGRDRDKMIDHVLSAEASYARKLGVRHKVPAYDDRAAVEALRADVLEVLSKPSDGTPAREPGWRPRYAARRIAWHVLDHAWEMQDKVM